MVARILFACVGNSCRSQMAEGFCRMLGEDVDCASAGSRPEARVDPNAVEAMKEVGIDISQAHPKGFDGLPGLGFDYLVTMGCEVECPFLPGARVINWQIPDPKGKGIEEYRRVRESIRSEVKRLLTDLGRLRPE